MLGFNEYQNWSFKTAKYPTTQNSDVVDPQEFKDLQIKALSYTALGLNGEAGEVADKIKRVIRGDGEYDNEVRLEIIRELGDVLWYVARLAVELDVDLDQVAAINMSKLEARLVQGKIKGKGDNR